MKIIANRKGLLDSLQLVSGAISTKDVKPILRNVLCITTGTSCTLVATDLELGIRLEMRSIKVEDEGESILPLAKLMHICRESPDEEITIDVDDARCKVRSKSGKWELPTEPPASFPPVPDFDVDACHEVSGKVLRELIGKTHFAAKVAVMSYATTGVLVEAVGEDMAMVATDGGMLVRMNGEAHAVGDHTTEGKSRVMTVKALKMLGSIITDDEEKVRVCLRDSEALWKTERATIYTRLIDGQFPKYRSPPTNSYSRQR